MAAGDLFSNADRLAIDATIRKCEQQSRIEFSVFGSARADGNVPAEMRQRVGEGFKVDTGERLVAPHFELVLQDDFVVEAQRRMTFPLPMPEIGGQLSGYFDFDLERGQGAQTFP